MIEITTDIPQLLSDIHARIFEPDRIPIAVCALLLVAVVGFAVGPFQSNARPLLWHVWGFLFGRLGDKLGNPQRMRADLLFRGFLLCVFAVFMAVLLGRAAEILTGIYPYYAVPEVLLLSMALSSGALWNALMRLYKVLDRPGSEKGVFFMIAQTTRTNLNSTDNFGITRAGMALAARSFDKGAVAPVLWYLIGGLPFVFAYSALAALSWRFGKDGFSKGFGETALALEKLFGAVPTFLSGFLLTAASIVTPSAGIARSIGSWFVFQNSAPYAQGGLPVSVMAYALNISLGGPVQDLGGSALKNTWVGPKGASAKVDHHHLRRGLYIVIIAHIFWVAALLGAYLYSA